LLNQAGKEKEMRTRWIRMEEDDRTSVESTSNIADLDDLDERLRMGSDDGEEEEHERQRLSEIFWSDS
jgi:hypothetical protein